MKKMLLIVFAFMLFSLLALSNVQSTKSQTYFNDEFSGSVSPNWQQIRGTWLLVNGSEYFTSAGNSLVIVNGLNLTDFVLETRMRFIDPINYRTGLVFRYSSFSDFYSFEIGNQFNEIGITRYSPVNPTSGETGAYISPSMGNSSIALSLNSNYTLRIEARGPQFKGYINDQKVVSWTDYKYSSGSVGLRANQAGVCFEYIKVSALTESTPSPTLTQSPTPTPTSSPNTPAPSSTLNPAQTPYPTTTLTASPQPTTTSPPNDSPSTTPKISPAVTASTQPTQAENPSPSPSIPELSSIVVLPIIAVVTIIAVHLVLREKQVTNVS